MDMTHWTWQLEIWNSCHFDAAGMLRGCCGLGAKQGQDVYLAGQLLPSSLEKHAQLPTTHDAHMFVACYGRVNANAELIVD